MDNGGRVVGVISGLCRRRRRPVGSESMIRCRRWRKYGVEVVSLTRAMRSVTAGVVGRGGVSMRTSLDGARKNAYLLSVDSESSQ